MDKAEFEQVVKYYDREGYMHPNDVDKLIELAEKSFHCCGGECQDETVLKIT